MQTYPRSAVQKLLADLGIEDPDSVSQVIIDVGHITVIGYERDMLETFLHKGPKPAQWSRVFPVDFQS